MNEPADYKKGRPRCYEFEPRDDVADDEAAGYASSLDELRERVYDQIVDLPPEAINFVSPGTPLSIGWLAAHLAGGEADWMGRITRSEVPDAVRHHPEYARLTPYGEPLPAFGSAASLIELGRLVGREATLPMLRSTDIDASTHSERLTSVRRVLLHLMWHWSFHSGHIGLIRLQWGSEYEWTFE